jgi:hypothetical protein
VTCAGSAGGWRAVSGDDLGHRAAGGDLLCRHGSPRNLLSSTVALESPALVCVIRRRPSGRRRAANGAAT